MSDAVNHPSHYTAGNIECIDAIREALGPDGFIDYCRGNAIKYTWRAGLKGDLGEDLAKGAWYLNAAAKEAKNIPKAGSQPAPASQTET